MATFQRRRPSRGRRRPVSLPPPSAPRPGADGLDGARVVRVRVRVRTPRRKARRRAFLRRAFLRTFIGIGIVLVGSVLWVGLRALQARQDLKLAQSGVSQVRADLLAADSAKAGADLQSATRQADAARGATHDPIWTVAGHVPFLGRPVRAIAGLTQVSADLTSRTFPALVRTAGVVSSQRIRLDHGAVDLQVLGAQAAPLAGADADVRHDLDRVTRLPHAGVGAVDRARGELADQLIALNSEVHAAAVTAQVGPAMLGADGPRSYFVSFQNTAEARGTGGITGAYVILHADGGKLTVTARGSDADLRDDLPASPVTSSGLALDTTSGSRQIWRNANVGADFSAAASTFVSLWQAQTGQHLDGAFAVDPQVLSYLLAVTGPAALPDGSQVDAGNAVALTEQRVYDTFDADRGTRQSYLQLVSSATIDKVLAAPGTDGQGLLQALRRAAGQHRLLLYSGYPAEQRALATTPASGVLPGSDAPTALLTLVNASGNKIDYYVGTSLRYHATTCSGTQRDVTVTITITNDAPTAGLPAVVAARLDGAAGPAGSEVSLVSYYATAGAGLSSATLDGAPVLMNVNAESGHPVFGTPVTLLPGGATRTLVLHLSEPVLSGSVQTRPQALVQPQLVTVDAPTCTG